MICSSLLILFDSTPGIIILNFDFSGEKKKHVVCKVIV